MELFGLMNLLNSLLPTNEKKEVEPPPETPSPSPVATTPQVPPTNNACADFFVAHERRAKKRKNRE